MVENTHENYNIPEFLEMLAKARNYNKWIADTLRPFLGKRVLEIGAGTGNMSVEILDRELILATEPDENFIDILKNNVNKYPNIKVIKYDLTKPAPCEIIDSKCNSAICINVLEHIEDDVQALKNMANAIVEGGNIILFNPALQSIYGTVDKFAGHFRRYSKKSIYEMAKKANMKVEHCFYFNFVGTFGWFANGKIFKKQIVNNSQITLFNKLVPIFSTIETLCRPPFGQSIVAVLKK